jgi:ferrous iron transport protein B
MLEPLLKPLGWDWQVGVGLIGAFAAREVFISTLGMVYGVEGRDGEEVTEESASLRARIKSARHPNGEPVFTPISALALLIFFSLACQCMSTLAAVKRETGGYRWPLFMFGYMSALAYGCALLVTWVGRLVT